MYYFKWATYYSVTTLKHLLTTAKLLGEIGCGFKRHEYKILYVLIDLGSLRGLLNINVNTTEP